MRFCIVLLSGVFLLACRKENTPGIFEGGQIALTFDDASIENWHQHLSLLDSLNVKATFYVSHYHTFGPRKKALLKEIAQHGHEIGYHTATHPDLSKEVAKIGMARVEETEIKTDRELMRADGYAVENFAYPFGSHTAQLNTCLLRTFKTVRVVTNAGNYRNSLTKEVGNKRVLYGLSVDNSSFVKDDKIVQLMNDARQNHDCLVLFAHQISNRGTQWQVSLDRLRLIAKEAAQRHLRFVTISEITP